MREILFHGKRTDNGEWVEGFLVRKTDPLLRITYSFILKQEFDTSCIDGRQTLLKSEMTWYRVDPETVGQYTSLRDCTRTKEHSNGKRIFEGDVVYDGFTKDKVVFEDCQWKLVDRYGKWIDLFNREIEVIGNIHDNPELLEELYE